MFLEGDVKILCRAIKTENVFLIAVTCDAACLFKLVSSNMGSSFWQVRELLIADYIFWKLFILKNLRIE